MVKVIQVSPNFDLECEQEGTTFTVSAVQRLPWRPIMESRTAYNKKDGNDLYLAMKAKYSSPIFYRG